MGAEEGRLAMKLVQVFLAKMARRPEGDIQSPGRMTLGEQEHVVLLEHRVMQGQEDLQCREIAADMADLALVVHAQQASASCLYDVRKLLHESLSPARHVFQAPNAVTRLVGSDGDMFRRI